MITVEKLKEYKCYHGYYDGFYIQKVKNGTNITTDEEWHLIGSLIQDIKLIRRTHVSEEFKNKLQIKILKYCSDKDTIDYLYELSENEW